MIDDLLSIVVPVYNVAPYLDRSIQSLLGQTYRNIEIILVDDGSTDGSGEICRKYAGLDPRIKLISQENQGAAVARRNGVRLASGRYTTYMDPDDYVDKNLYEKLMARSGDFDVVISQWLRESAIETRRCYDTFKSGAYNTPEDMEFLLRHLINVSLPGGEVNIRPGIAAYLWNKLFKTEVVREVVEAINVNSPNFNDDRPIIYGVMLKSSSVLFTEICGYHYFVRENSLAHVSNWDCNRIKNICQFYEMMEPVFSEDPRSNILIPQLQLKLAEGIVRDVNKMGFPPEAQLQLRTPVFPYINLLGGRRVALYGAGHIGRNYRRQIKKWNICDIAVWIDENWEEYVRTGLTVEPVERLLEADYDFIVLACADRTFADNARRELVSMGIKDSLILWKAPLEIS